MTRLVAYQDQEALSQLRLGAVVLDRRGEVWQVLLVRYADQPTRGWFRLGDTGSIYGAGVVAEQGPLRVLYDRGTDLPDNVEPCSSCGGTTNDPESDAAAPSPCPRCSGAGWLLVDDPLGGYVPIALAEALDRTAVLVPSEAPQALLPPISLIVGMTVNAEPKAAHAGRVPHLRGIVLEVEFPLDEQRGRVLLSAFDDGRMVKHWLLIREYSFRPVEDA